MTRLKRVVFPAPFGPISPYICLSAISKEMSLNAIRPPKLLDMFLISNMSRPRPCEEPPYPVLDPPYHRARNDAVGAEYNHDNQNSTIKAEAPVRHETQQLRENAENDCTQYGPPEGIHPSQNHVENGHGGDEDIEVAPRPKVPSFSRVTFSPMELATSGSSLTASRERPSRE